ncbi:MAG TPA: methionyl-tRNA formyltransferase [Paracoccaceae bacterium]|nr:methionyl-tRNA formyltransferase [Paracoccaceae bacterium]
MRIILNGQQAFGRAALEKLLAAGKDEVVAVFTAPDQAGRPADPVKQAALERGLPLYQPASYRDPETLEALRELDADLMLMAYVVIFIPEAARNIPRMGSICFHPSLLPRHRGPSSINWAILMGETRTGLTWFYPTDGLDEGDILLQWECEIGPDETLGELYFGKIFPAGVDSVLEVAELFRAGRPPRRPQEEARATYESWCRKADVKVDWAAPVAETYNRIRAGNPQPGAWTLFRGEELSLYDSRREPGEGHPGEVVAVGPEGVVVQGGGGRVRLIRVRPKGGEKMPAASWAAAAGLAPGQRLDS